MFQILFFVNSIFLFEKFYTHKNNSNKYYQEEETILKFGSQIKKEYGDNSPKIVEGTGFRSIIINSTCLIAKMFSAKHEIKCAFWEELVPIYGDVFFTGSTFSYHSCIVSQLIINICSNNRCAGIPRIYFESDNILISTMCRKSLLFMLLKINHSILIVKKILRNFFYCEVW